MKEIMTPDHLEGIRLFDMLINSEIAKAYQFYPKENQIYERNKYAYENMFNYFLDEFENSEGVGQSNKYLAACWKCRIKIAELEILEESF